MKGVRVAQKMQVGHAFLCECSYKAEVGPTCGPTQSVFLAKGVVIRIAKKGAVEDVWITLREGRGRLKELSTMF